MGEEQVNLYEQIGQMLEENNPRLLKGFLDLQRSSDIAEVVELLDGRQRRKVFDVLDKPIAAEVLEKVDEATRAELFEVLEDRELVDLISHLDPDDAADVLAELEDEESREVLQSLDYEDAEQIKELMVYPEDSAGGIMDPVVLSVEEDDTVEETIQQIRQAEIDEDFFSIFVVNHQRKFIGDVRIRLLLTSPSGTPVQNLVDRNAIYVRVDTDQEEVSNLFKKNDLIVVPVVDNSGRLVGRITADRILEVAGEEAAEDMYTMAGTDPAELETISVFNAARVRMTWLLPCLAGAAVTAMVGMFFRNLFIGWDRLAIFVTAFLFSPMIQAISGNAGLQTSAIVVCGLATGDLAAMRMRQVFLREVRVAFLVAVCCGILGGLICGFLPDVLGHHLEKINIGTNQADSPPAAGHNIAPAEQVRIAIALGFAMFSAIMVSTTLGLSLPFFFRRIGLDPAISSGPLVTTANDSVSATIYMLLIILLTR